MGGGVCGVWVVVGCVGGRGGVEEALQNAEVQGLASEQLMSRLLAS